MIMICTRKCFIVNLQRAEVTLTTSKFATLTNSIKDATCINPPNKIAKNYNQLLNLYLRERHKQQNYYFTEQFRQVRPLDLLRAY